MRQRSLAFDVPASRLTRLSLAKKGVASFLLLSALAACGQPAPTSPSSPVVRGSKVPAMPPSSATLGDNLAALQTNAGLKSQAVITTAFCDDFNAFDTARWNTYTTPGYWGFYNTSGTYEAANTTVENGHLVLKLNYVSGDIASTVDPAVYRSAVVQSLDRMGYGTYETWVRAANTSNVPTTNGSQVKGTFSLLNSHMEYDYADAYTKPDTLIESKYGYGTANDLIFSTYKTNQPETTTQVTTPQNLSQGFHLQRWEWSPTALKFYVDGVLVHSITDPNLIPSEAANVFFNIWPVNKADWNMPGSSATRYTMVDKFCFTPQATTPTAITPLPEPSTNPIYLPSPIATLGGGLSFDLSDIDAETYQWTLGDGTTASGPYVDHNYATPGTYTVSVTVSRTSGETKTYTTQVGVLPEIQNIVSKRATSDSMTVHFDAGPPIPGVGYLFELGDGTTETRSQFDHTFANIGTYDYTLTLRDTRPQALTGQGLRAQATEAPILSRQTSFQTIWRKAPEAKLALTTPKGTDVPFGFAPLTVNFNATGSQDFNTGSGNLTYSWDFGDGTPPATTAQVSHVYPDPKPYLVTLTVTNEWGLSDTKRTYVHVRSLASNTVFNAEYPTIQAQSLSLSPQAEAQQLLRDFPGPNLPFQAQGLQSQTLQAQATGDVEDVFPYVLAWNHNIKTGIHRITNAQGSATFGFCNSYIPYKDGTQIYPLYQYHYIDPNDPTDETFCKAMVFTSGTIGRFPAKPLRTLLISTSRGLHNIQFNVFHHLSVPRVNVSVVPDDFIAGEQGGPKVREYHFINPQTGKDEYLVNVLVRQSEAQSGNVKFRIPVLAVNETNQFMTTVSGAFYASFPNAPTVQEPLTMVKGKAYITLNLPINAYSAAQQSIDLSTISMQGPLGCGFDSSPMGAASGARLAGCGAVNNTYEFPVSTATQDIPAYPAELSKTLTLGNHVFYGDAADAAKAFKAYAQVGYVTAQTFVEYTAPFTLIPEKREELQRQTDALITDGVLSVKDAATISLLNVGVWASALPVGPLKIPPYAAFSAASRNGIGATAKALDQVVDANAVRGLKTSEVAERLAQNAGNTLRAIEDCGQTCINDLDEGIEALVRNSSSYLDALKKIEARAKPISCVSVLSLNNGTQFLNSLALPDISCYKPVPYINNKNFNFGKWFNSLTDSELDIIFQDKDLKRIIQDRLRSPGGQHEWLMVARAPTFKRWGLDAEDIWRLRTKITDIEVGQPIILNGEIVSVPIGGHAGQVGSLMHTELLTIIDNSLDFIQFKQNLANWANYRLVGGAASLPAGLKP